jgi:hypothetical protein
MSDEVEKGIGPRLMIVVVGFLAVRLWACTECMPRE